MSRRAAFVLAFGLGTLVHPLTALTARPFCELRCPRTNQQGSPAVTTSTYEGADHG